MATRQAYVGTRQPTSGTTSTPTVSTPSSATVTSAAARAERIAALRAQQAAAAANTAQTSTTATGRTIGTIRTGTPTATTGAAATRPGVRTASDATAGNTVTAAGARIGSRVSATRTGDNVPVAESVVTDPNARSLPSRKGTGAASSLIRRPSKLVVEREKKTDYWRDVAKEVQTQGTKLNGDDLNSVISRAMGLGLVGDKKQRESLSGPKANELLANMKLEMERRMQQLSGGKINTSDLVAQNATLMETILALEKKLTTLESSKNQQDDEEKAKVQSKITELEQSLRALEAQKKEQKEQSRRTMKLEIANLKEMMAKVQNQQHAGEVKEDGKALAAKMNRLEAALRLLNEERKKDKVEDKETLLLKRKLQLFEQKLKDMEEEKKLKQNEESSNAMRDKLVLMEEKLAKMERRKSVSMTMMMQQKMEAVEKQLTILRAERAKGHSDDTNKKIQEKMALLDKQLREMAAQKVTPAMVNDEETVALRNHIKKLEMNILTAEKKMEEQRIKLEEDRKLAWEKRQLEEEEFRRQSKQTEELLVKKIQEMEKRLAAGANGLDPAVIERLKRLEAGGIPAGIDPNLSSKILDMEAKLKQTQEQLAQERKLTREFFESAPKETRALEAWQKDAQIAWLQQTNAQLMAKLEATNKMIDEKMEILKHVPVGGAVVHKSGLTYDEINKKLAEIQSKLFDPNTDERESEQLNIEYEKLITELEQTPEYLKEQELVREKWKQDNAPANLAAFKKVTAEMTAMGDMKLTQILKRKPELRLLTRTPDQQLKMHENDFKQLSTQALSLDEARALYHNSPPFKKEQAKQSEWVQQLQAKIEEEMKKPPKTAPPPIIAKKKVVIKKDPKADTSGGGFLEELLKKRKKKD